MSPLTNAVFHLPAAPSAAALGCEGTQAANHLFDCQIKRRRRVLHHIDGTSTVIDDD